jgi:hypothetical protein
MATDFLLNTWRGLWEVAKAIHNIYRQIKFNQPDLTNKVNKTHSRHCCLEDWDITLNNVEIDPPATVSKSKHKEFGILMKQTSLNRLYIVYSTHFYLGNVSPEV